MFKTIELVSEDALDTVFRACHSLNRELRTRVASGAETCLMACRDCLMQAGLR